MQYSVQKIGQLGQNNAFAEMHFQAKAKICLMCIKNFDMVIPIAFNTFQMILKTIPIIKFYFIFKKMIIYIFEV